MVAEEVRSLAQRCAEAAKQTAAIIERGAGEAAEGVQQTENVVAMLGTIDDSVARVNEVLAEVAAASQQQSEGVSQLTSAGEQLNEVTQQAAANSEESAAAATELSSQAAHLQALVDQFQLEERVAAEEPDAGSEAGSDAGGHLRAGA